MPGGEARDMSKLSKADWIALAGIVLSIVGVLPFFKIDVGTISDLFDAMSGKAWFLTFSLLILAIGLFLKWRERKVTPRNVRAKVRGWLDAFQILAAPLPIPNTYFVWRATLHSRLEVWVGRTHALPGYITIVASVGTQAQSQAFNALAPNKKNEFWRNLFVEISRSRIAITRNPNDPDRFGTLTIEKLLPITHDLSESMLIETLREIDFDAYMLFWTVEFLLDTTVAPPLLTSQTETPPASAGPTGPTGPTQPSPKSNKAEPGPKLV